ncbi:hypothetical protein BS47DRAFT_502017 [Hydnum rufescens UP504]|uniref:Uncharacterized protein n=1 Tax=Hydnum rufescens UP504 TaxID=1448309 RepID=A0A9P6B553_9AGAM|nr:hypothetical protein BS47DRAFT_502017 [Hydnum rufescens UP504]
MCDINPKFRPRQTPQLSFGGPKHKAPYSQPAVNSSGNLLTNYFSISATPRLKKVSSESALGQRSRDIAKENIAIEQLGSRNATIGYSSGKRTLTGEHDLSKLREYHRDEMKNASSGNGVTSRFFGSTTPSNVPSRRPFVFPPQKRISLRRMQWRTLSGKNLDTGHLTAGCSELGEVSSPLLSPEGCRKAQIPLSDIDDVSSPVLYRHLRNRNASPEYVESGNDEGDASDTPEQLGVPPSEDTARRRVPGLGTENLSHSSRTRHSNESDAESGGQLGT